MSHNINKMPLPQPILTAQPFVNEVLHFFRNQITELKEQPDLVESLEVAVQCLEAVYSLPNAELDNEASTADVVILRILSMI